MIFNNLSSKAENYFQKQNIAYLQELLKGKKDILLGPMTNFYRETHIANIRFAQDTSKDIQRSGKQKTCQYNYHSIKDIFHNRFFPGNILHAAFL